MMNQFFSNPRRVGWACLAALLLIGIVTGCPSRSDQNPRPPQSPPPSPAVTDSSGVAPVTEEPAARETTEKPGPAFEVEEPQTQTLPAPVESKPADAEMVSEEPADNEMESDEPDAEDPNDRLDFGEPLVEGLTDNERLDLKQPIWLTKDLKSVVMQSMVCQTQAPLEMFACLLRSKEHESVLAVPVKAYIVHTGLLAAGAKPGSPVRWDPKFEPPTGTEIEITVLWKDANGKVQKTRAQNWVRDMTTGKAMTYPWVFSGSGWYEDEETGKKYYMADSTGDLICVSNFASATLDVPVESSDSNASLMFQAFTENIPPLGTPVTMVLTPKVARADEKSD